MNYYRDYYNYLNNNYNQPNYNQNNVSLYEPYEGFIRGNMFKDLYNKYKTNEPIKIVPKNKQAELLTTIDCYQEFLLYLLLRFLLLKLLRQFLLLPFHLRLPYRYLF